MTPICFWRKPLCPTVVQRTTIWPVWLIRVTLFLLKHTTCLLFILYSVFSDYHPPPLNSFRLSWYLVIHLQYSCFAVGTLGETFAYYRTWHGNPSRLMLIFHTYICIGVALWGCSWRMRRWACAWQHWWICRRCGVSSSWESSSHAPASCQSSASRCSRKPQANHCPSLWLRGRGFYAGPSLQASSTTSSQGQRLLNIPVWRTHLCIAREMTQSME